MRTGPLEIAALLVIMLAGCRGEGEGNGASSSRSPSGGGAVQTATLTGLYESGDGPRRNQMCVVEKEGAANFGFVIWGKGDTSCSASGPASREGDRLRLRLDGDESCAIEARIEGRRVSFPTDIAEQCHSYYCGAGAQMRGATFDKVAGEERDAMRAADLAGDPICNN